ncbi:MAG TPA: hypothetical protein VE080_00535 [Candidatus Aquicultoraceae bacterium]|jgi:hypothetical protein|nr:hypothetical protein [Candidatus Aquicultoraceae bacterium]
MRKILAAGILLLMITPAGCSSRLGSAGAGAVGGAAAGAGGYEYHMSKEKNRVESDYRAGRIDRREYEIRMDQINRDSVFR